MKDKETKKSNAGLSKCCKARVCTTGGGMNGEIYVDIEDFCTKCGKKCEVIKRVGRPLEKLPF